MTEPNIPTGENPRTGTAARIGWAILILLTLYVCYFTHLGAIGFVGPDEPRYAWIARDMLETGDWVTPRLYGKPWFEKPPLFYWGAALCFRIFGVSEAAARLPSAISALLATLALAWLALRLYGAETARWLLLLLPTTVGMIGFSHAAATDMPFSGMLTIAMVCAAVALGLTRNEHTPILPRTPWLALICFGFFLGLAVLAKGPAAIILCGGTVFFWALFTKHWSGALRLFRPAALASFCLTALPWYILCARRSPDFFRVFIIEHNFKRYLTPEFQHIQPFWFYVPVLLVAFLPWTALFLWSSIEGAAHLWRTRYTRDSTWFLICWAMFCMIFFSISRSKLPGYVLPAFPAVGLLISYMCVSKAQGRHKSFRLALFLAALCFLLLVALTKELTPHISQGNERLGVFAAILFASLGTANLLLGSFYPMSGKGGTWSLHAVVAVVPVLVAVSLTDKLVMSYFRWDPSGSTIARELQLRKIPGARLAVTQMSRGMVYSLSFYMHEDIKTWDSDHPTQGYLLTGGLRCRYWVRPPLVCEQVPFDEETTGRFLFRVTVPQLMQGAPSSREPHQKE